MHIRRGIMVALLAGMLVGCASVEPAYFQYPSAKSLEGQWLFAHFVRGRLSLGIPAPPQFDDIEFKGRDKIRIRSTLAGWDFSGKYTLSENDLAYEFQPPDVNEPVRHAVKCALVDGGDTLILNFDDAEMVYYRPGRFHPNAIAGEWKIEVEGDSEIMRLEPNGSYFLVESKITGYYRLYSSRYGSTMSAVIFIPEHGVYLTMFQYERQGEKLLLTPISDDGPVPDAVMTWMLQTGEPSPGGDSAKPE